jgi:hypothetical protein
MRAREEKRAERTCIPSERRGHDNILASSIVEARQIPGELVDDPRPDVEPSSVGVVGTSFGSGHDRDR